VKLLVPRGFVLLLNVIEKNNASISEVHQALYDGDLKASAILSDGGVKWC